MSRLQPLPFDAVPPQAWRSEVLVRFSHCDPAGIMYFANHFDVLNGVVEDWFVHDLELDYRSIIRDRRIGLGFASAKADFLRPVAMGDRLVYVPLIDRIGVASLTLRMLGYRDEDPVVVAKLAMVATSLDVHRAIPLPDDLRAAFTRRQELLQ